MKKIILVAVPIFALILALLITYPIFRAENPADGNYSFNNAKTDKKSDVYLLQYRYTTGSGWTVIDSTDKSAVSKEVVLYNAFDPRFLKDNKNFDLDYTATLSVKANKTKDTVINGENSTLLFADEVTILFDTKKTRYSMSDMSFPGIIKSIIGIFNHKFKLSY